MKRLLNKKAFKLSPPKYYSYLCPTFKISTRIFLVIFLTATIIPKNKGVVVK